MLIHNEANILIESFLNSASHELRTPLTVVTGNVQLAQRRLQILLQQLSTRSEQPPDEFSQKMERIEQILTYADQSANRLNVLLDTIIADVQIHQGKFVLTMNRFHLNELLKEVVERQQRQNPEVKLQLQISPHAQDLLILADQRRIEQVVTIYVINAITRTPPNQTVVMRTEATQESVRVSVTDQGSAIPVELQKDIWARFSRPWEDKPALDSNWNLGLGLSLCREIIQEHQGQVGLQSDQEHGTTFWFTLPITSEQ